MDNHQQLATIVKAATVMSPSTLPSLVYRLPRICASSSSVLSIYRCHRSFSAAKPALSFSVSHYHDHALFHTPLGSLPHPSPPRLCREYFLRSSLSSRHPSHRQHYAFSSSAMSAAANVLQNPRVDEEGKELWINISPRAAEVGVIVVAFYLFFSRAFSLLCLRVGAIIVGIIECFV